MFQSKTQLKFGNFAPLRSIGRTPVTQPETVRSVAIEDIASCRSVACASTSASVEPTSSSSQAPGPNWYHNVRAVNAWLQTNKRAMVILAGSLIVWTLISSTHTGGLFASLSMGAHSSTEKGLSAAAKSAWAGLAAGCLHTLAGPDHLAALTPLTIGRSRLKATVLGALWGWGHSVGQLILGLLFILLKDQFNGLVPALSKWGGSLIGLSLIGIGCLGIYECFFEKEEDQQKHQEETMNELQPALAAVGGEASAAAGTVKKEKSGFGLATFATGILYGLNPDTLFVILPALALPTKLAAFGYISMFVLGTVLAMSGYTFAIGATTEKLGRKVPKATKGLSVAASAVALLFGGLFVATGMGYDLPFGLEL